MVDAEMIKVASSFALTVYLKHYLKYLSGKARCTYFKAEIYRKAQSKTI